MTRVKVNPISLRHKVSQPNQAQNIAVSSVNDVLSNIDTCYMQAAVALWVECKLHEARESALALVRMVPVRIKHRRLEGRPTRISSIPSLNYVLQLIDAIAEFAVMTETNEPLKI